MLNGEKPLSTNNSCRGWRRPKKKPKNEAFKSERSIPKTTLRRTEPYNMLKRTTKPLRRRVLTEECLAKSSKTQHLENTDKWHFCNGKQVVFRTVNHRGPLPLKELHSTGETIVWRDPGGSWACLLPVYHWVCNHPATGCDMCTTHEKHAKIVRREKHLEMLTRTKPQEELGTRRCMPPPPPPPPGSIQN